MSGERDDPVVDELERELREALAVEPSPDFARQVRARIGQSSETPRHSLFGWQLALAAAVCVVAVGLGWRAVRQPDMPATPATEVAARDVSRPSPPADAGRPVPAHRVTPAPPRMPGRTAAAERVAPRTPAAEPEIIVPAEGVTAVTRLLALARSGAMTEETLKPVAVAPVPETLDVTPLVVPPLAPPDAGDSRTAQGGAREE